MYEADHKYFHGNNTCLTLLYNCCNRCFILCPNNSYSEKGAGWNLNPCIRPLKCILTIYEKNVFFFFPFLCNNYDLFKQ